MEQFGSEAITRGIRIRVTTRYLPDRSDPTRGVRVFGYRVRIANFGDSAARLVGRHWIITDGWGNENEVRGPGVVGQQPRIEPGQEFEYTSFCPLPTPTGSMRGSYQMVDDDGSEFDAAIDTFHLAEPGPLN